MENHNPPLFDSTLLPDNLGVEDSATLVDIYSSYLVQLDTLAEVFARPGDPDSNRNEIQASAHKFKSSSLAVGASRLSHWLKLLEVSALDKTPELKAIFSSTILQIQPTRDAVKLEITRLQESPQ